MTLAKKISLIGILLMICASAQAQFFGSKQPELLHESEAFLVDYSTVANGLSVRWSIADDYYMYRDQFEVIVLDGDTPVQLELNFPERGLIENDPEFGEVEVFFFNAPIIASFPDTFEPQAGQTYTLKLNGQGCNKPVGLCYPPMKRDAQVSWTADQLTAVNASNSSARAELPNNNVAVPSGGENEKSFWGYVLSAFIGGLLLSFTPCVLPMIPILSGIIAKQQNPSRLAAGGLAICYVAGTIVTYLIAGWIAGASGTQLQAYFQNPWVIGFICLLLITLAASLFGAFKLESPAAFQTKVHKHSSSLTEHDEERGNVVALPLKSFGLGLISALVVGACVSPILILALGAAITQGDPVLGAAIMGSMAAGMGVLLIVFGFGAGWLLPKTGPWMTQVQTLFGFMVIGVAIYIAGALTFVPVLMLWALLLITVGFYIWQLASVDSATENPGLAASLGKALALAAVVWGCLALIGYSSGGRQILSPLSELSLGKENGPTVELPFETTTTLEQTLAVLDSAKSLNQPVLVDFYADWCFDCVRMKRTTFKEPEVADALAGWRLLVIDVTDTNDDSEEVKRYFNVFGPPATLLISAQGLEVDNSRQYGFMDKDEFIAHIAKAST